MSVAVQPGGRYQSAVCDTEVVVVKAPVGPLDLRCGGSPMTGMGPEKAGEPSPGFDGGTQLGKRYVNADGSVEVLATKAGDGALSIGGEVLAPKDAKPLPSSD